MSSGSGDANVDGHFQDMPQVVDNIHIHRIRYSQFKLSGGNGDGKYLIFSRVLLGYQFFYCLSSTGKVLERYEGYVKFVGEHKRDVVILAVLLFDQHIDETAINVGGGCPSDRSCSRPCEIASAGTSAFSSISCNTKSSADVTLISPFGNNMFLVEIKRVVAIRGYFNLCFQKN